MEGDATLHHGECEFFTLSCEPHKFWIYLTASLAIITAAGLMAGLTMGLVSLDMRNMRILEMEGSPDEKARAKRIIPIISRHHLLLVTLLLGNACANEALPIFLSKLVPETVSILLSVTCVLLFGEIIPSAIFTGPNQLKIASSLTPVVRALMLLTSPVSYPIAKILDYALGSDHSLARYKRQELKALVALQRENDGLHQSIKKVRRRRRRNAANSDDHEASGSEYEDNDDHQTHYVEHHDMQNEPVGEHAGQGTQLHVDEVTIIHGALDLTAKTISQVMIPIDQVFMLEYHTKLDANVLADILASGHSRIPIYKDHKANIVGVLLVKRLIVLDPADARPVSDLALRKPIVVNPNESCYHILNEFQKGGSHLALVTADASKVAQCWKDRVDIPKSVSFVGIITIEDVIEELIQEEIEDESDVRANGIVQYWRARSNKREAFKKSSSSMSSTLGKSTFVVSRLKSLAERARARVQSRSGPRKRPTSATRGGLQEPEPPLEVRIDLHEPASPKEE